LPYTTLFRSIGDAIARTHSGTTRAFEPRQTLCPHESQPGSTPLGLPRHETGFPAHFPSSAPTPLPSALERLDCPVGPHKLYGSLFTGPAIRERPAAHAFRQTPFCRISRGSTQARQKNSPI